MGITSNILEHFKLKSEVKLNEIQEEENNEEEVDENNEEEKSFIWDENILPLTDYLKNQTRANKCKIEEISNLNYKPSKIISIAHAITLELLKKLSARDLIEYDGKKKSLNITYLINFNKGLINYLGKDAKFKILKKMAKNSELCKDYNLVNIIQIVMRQFRLSKKKLELVKFYKDLIENGVPEGYVLPFEWMIKDCADSNVNVDSEIASMRFCKIIDKVNEMKAIEYEFILKEKHRQFLFGKIFENLEKKHLKPKTKKLTSKNLSANL